MIGVIRADLQGSIGEMKVEVDSQVTFMDKRSELIWVYIVVALAVLSLSSPAHATAETWIPTSASMINIGLVTETVNESDDAVILLERDGWVRVLEWNGSAPAYEIFDYALVSIEIDNAVTNRDIQFAVNTTGSFVTCTGCTQSADSIGNYTCNVTEHCDIDTVTELNSMSVRYTITGTFVPPSETNDIDYLWLDIWYPPYTTPYIHFIDPTDPDDAHVNRDYTFINVSTTPYRRDTFTLDWNGTNQTLISQDYVNKTGLGDGTYLYYTCVNNTQGQVNCTETRAVTIDTVYPLLTVNSPFNTTYPSTTIAFNVTATDLYLDSCYYDLDGQGYISLPYAGYGDDYYGENSTMAQGSHHVIYMCDDTAGNQNVSAVRYFSVDTLPPLAPVNVLPYNTDHTNVNQTNFTWTQPYDQTGVDAYQLQVSNSTGFEAGNISVDKDSIYAVYYELTVPETLADGQYYWRVRANDTLGNGYGDWSSNFSIVIDTIYPDWILSSYPAFDNSTLVSDSVIWDMSVSDANLYRILLNVTDSSSIEKHSNYTGDWNDTVFTFGHTTDVSGWDDGNYTVELSATDDHTYGDLNGLTYEIHIDGISFCKDSICKRIYLGYYSDSEFHNLTPEEVIDLNVSIEISDTGYGEYKFNITLNRPATDIQFGFTASDNQMIAKNVSIGHFIWRDWYLDFEDLLGTGFPITYIHIDGYHVIYTNMTYCPVAVGELCKLDPAVGGLNTQTEYYNIEVDNTAPIISDYTLTDHQYDPIDLNESVTGGLYASWNLSDPNLNLSTCSASYRAYDIIDDLYQANWSFINKSLNPALDSDGWLVKDCDFVSGNPDNTTVRVSLNLTCGHEWMPTTFNFNPDNVSKDTSINAYQGNIVKVQINNVTVSANTSYIFRFQVDEYSATTSVDFVVYGCNKSYVSGDPRLNPICTPADAVSVDDLYDECDYYNLNFVTDENGTFNGIQITDTMYAIGTSFNALNNEQSWDVWATDGIECPDKYQSSTDYGVTWNDVTGSCGNHHLTFFNGFQGEFRVSVNDTVDNDVSEVIYDIIGQIDNLPPALTLHTDSVLGGFPTVYNGTNISEAGIIWLNTTVSDPNQDWVNCSYYLLNDDLSLNRTILALFELNASYGTCYYGWDTTLDPDDDYYIQVDVTDGIAVSTDILGETMRIDNTYPVLSAVTINAIPTTDQDTMFNVTVTETNIDTVLFEFNQTVNHTVITYSGTGYWHVISHTEYTKGDIVYYRYHVNDTVGHQSSTALYNFTVDNSVPVVTENYLYPDTIYNNQTLNLTVECTDLDSGETLTVYWDIYAGSTLLPDLSGSMVVNDSDLTLVYIIPDQTFASGQFIRSKVICGDSYDNSPLDTSDPIYVMNSQPVLSTIALTDIAFKMFDNDTAFTYNNIYLHMICSDIDHGTLLTAYWNVTRNGAVVTSLSGSSFILANTSVHVQTIPSGNTAYGDIWSATGICDDGDSNSSLASAGNLTILIPETILTHSKGYDATAKAGGLVTGIVENTNLAVALIVMAVIFGGALLIIK